MDTTSLEFSTYPGLQKIQTEVFSAIDLDDLSTVDYIHPDESNSLELEDFSVLEQL
jgi:hypothetical protein